MRVSSSLGKSTRLLPSSFGEFDRVISAAARLASTIRKDPASERSSNNNKTTPTGSARRSSGYKLSTVWLGSGEAESSSWMAKPANLRVFIKILSNDLRWLGVRAELGPR